MNNGNRRGIVSWLKDFINSSKDVKFIIRSPIYGFRIRGYYDRGRIVVNLDCFFFLSFIGQLVNPVGGERMG